MQYAHFGPGLSQVAKSLSIGAHSTRRAAKNKIKNDSITEHMQWPTDILVQFLHALAVDCDLDAQHAWHQLAFLVCKRNELASFANTMPRPILLRIAFEADEKLVFKVPFRQAKVVCIDIDWGDGCMDKIREKGDGSVQHTYAAAGEYSVRIFPAVDHPGDDNEAWLDHLGFGYLEKNRENMIAWWKPLREIVSLGRCGLRSLSFLFAHSGALQVDLQSLQTKEIRNLSGLFWKCKTFNQPIGRWDVSNVTDTSFMFYGASKFNQPLNGWNVGNVTTMKYMFVDAAAFDRSIGNWDVSNVTNMIHMFRGASKFNKPIGNWNVANLNRMDSMFRASRFNQPIGKWNVSNVTNMSFVFHYATRFNQPIGDWDVGNVTSMMSMFENASKFNQPIGNWNVSNVTSFCRMFSCAKSFNQSIGAWNVANARTMKDMFSGATSFDQPIGDWTIGSTEVAAMSVDPMVSREDGK